MSIFDLLLIIRPRRPENLPWLSLIDGLFAISVSLQQSWYYICVNLCTYYQDLFCSALKRRLMGRIKAFLWYLFALPAQIYKARSAESWVLCNRKDSWYLLSSSLQDLRGQYVVPIVSCLCGPESADSRLKFTTKAGLVVLPCQNIVSNIRET